MGKISKKDVSIFMVMFISLFTIQSVFMVVTAFTIVWLFIMIFDLLLLGYWTKELIVEVRK